MRSFSYAVVAVAVAAAGLQAAPPAEKQRDIWETVFARDREGRDQQIGYAHLSLEPVQADGKTLIRATRELRLTIKRDGQLAQLRADTGDEETEDGKVVAVFMKHWIGAEQALVMRGVVDPSGKKIQLTVETKSKRAFDNVWDPKVIGLSAEANILRDKKVGKGDSFSYRIFEPSISSVATIRVNVKDMEEVLPPRGGKKKLLRVESTPDKIADVQLPSSILWVDPETREPLMTQIDMPDFGLLTMLRSTKEQATGPLGNVPDLMKQQTIQLGQFIRDDVFNLNSITYQITLKGTTDLSKIVKADDRQTIDKLDDKKEQKPNEPRKYLLTVMGRRSPRIIEKEGAVGDEFIKSNHFVNSDDENVKKLAEKAVGKLTDPWEKAKAIEKWVKANMKAVNYTEAMATADHVAKTLSGDCSEYSMLAAAMCKAEGIPARTALGLVYVRQGEKEAALAFHMWTEVYVRGQWLGLDATLGRGGVGPGHIKITDHSWHDTLDFKPLLPVTGFIMAKPAIEIKAAVKD
jgi:hypothetical protein